MKLTGTIIGMILLLSSPQLGVAADKGSKKGKKHSDSEVSVKAGVSIFSVSDRDVIQRYVRGLPTDGLPPGLAKRGGSLPPGLEKQLRKNGTLPPGLQKKLTPFPAELERRLLPLAPDLERVFIEGRAVTSTKTRAILDIIVSLYLMVPSPPLNWQPSVGSRLTRSVPPSGTSPLSGPCQNSVGFLTGVQWASLGYPVIRWLDTPPRFGQCSTSGLTFRGVACPEVRLEALVFLAGLRSSARSLSIR